jgi:Zn-dependent M16 (insulinase) family peptidase
MILEQQKKDPATAGTFVPPAGWKRPFTETSTANELSIAKSSDHVVEFMEEDESSGNMMTTYLGSAPNDYVTDLALDIVTNYLSESATSPLQKEFVEIAEPLATHVGFMSEARVNKSELTLIATGVPRKLLNDMPNLIKAKLAKIVKEEGIDMERMALVLRRERRNTLDAVESRVSQSLSHGIIQDFLYGEKDGKELPQIFNDLEDFSVLDKWTAQDWINLIDKYLVSRESITTIGKPSAKLSAEIEKTEKERVAEQKAKFGEDGLKKLAEELEAAKQESDKPIPEEMLTAFPATKPSDLTWIPVETAINKAPNDAVQSDNGAVQAYIDADGTPLPYQTHFAQVASNFVLVNAVLDTTKIAKELLPYVAVFRWALFNAGVKRADGTVLNHEEVVDQLDDLTVYTSANFGVRSVFPESINISAKVEKERYGEAVAWLRDVLEGTQFTKER